MKDSHSIFPVRIDERIDTVHTRDMNTATKSPARIRLESAIAAKDTATLLGAHCAIENMDTKDAAQRLTAALIADCIEARHGLTEALEAIYVEDLDFTGTYHDALLTALVVTGADV